MLIGIVVTNAIVLIERVQQNREHGMETREPYLKQVLLDYAQLL